MIKRSPSLVKQAEAYEQILFEGELRRRFSHHMALVASERWLDVELAMLVNERAANLGLPGWSAIVEKGVIDVALIPPETNPFGTMPNEAIVLELKLIGAKYWPHTWDEVRGDLAGKRRAPTAKARKAPDKPPADYAVCFLVNHLSHPMSKRRAKTDEDYSAYHAAIPSVPCEFEPVAWKPKLQLVRSSPPYRLEWPRPVCFRWPDRYDATVRILWVTETGRDGKL